MRKNKTKQRRVINVPKEFLEELRQYCKEQALNPSRWLQLIAREAMKVGANVAVAVVSVDPVTGNHVRTRIK